MAARVRDDDTSSVQISMQDLEDAASMLDEVAAQADRFTDDESTARKLHTIRAALQLAAAYQQLAGERSQHARAALLAELAATSPESVSPASLRQATREAAHRQRLLQTPTYTYEELRQLRGDGSVQTTRTAVSRMLSRGQAFTVQVSGRRVVPAFLLTEDGSPRPELAPLVRPLREAGIGAWQMWTWLTSPTGLLSGGVPAQMAFDPETAGRAALAAVRFADQATTARMSATV